jgi:polysaccharide pyruvyl transferase WcaK-like protein
MTSQHNTMNILVTTGLGSSIISFGNMGDVSMLQAGLDRLATLWPEANINVLTEWPANLLQFSPKATPIQAIGRDLLIGDDILLGRFTKFFPQSFRLFAADTKRRAALRFPSAMRHLLAAVLVLQNRRAKATAVSRFSKILGSTDLVVACGSGGFFDSCRDWNMKTLDVVEAAVQRGIPVAMFGQHFGPLTDSIVLSRARRILPRLDLITLRGNPGALTFLSSIGVPISKIRTTGDEAIELAYEVRPSKLGGALGVNFRLRTSAETSDTDIEALRPVLHLFAKKHKISLVPTPIAVDSGTCDYLAIKKLLEGFDDSSDGGASLSTPLEVIKQVGRCRVVVTCAYHAAVFALSQGIPVVAFTKSSYFVEKFRGLNDQFGMGCEIVFLDQPNVPEHFNDAIDRAWQTADDIHVPLLQAAARQIQLSHESYNWLRELTSNYSLRTEVVGSVQA